MSEAAVIERDEAGQRCGWMIRKLYGTNAAKALARDFDIALATAEKVLAGKLPENRLLVAMARKWGRGFTDFVLLGPDDWQSTAQLEGEIAALEAKAAELRQRIRGA